MRSLAFIALLGTACSAAFDLPGGRRGDELAVTVEPTGSLDSAPGVLRLRVNGGASRSALTDYRAFAGSLGAYHLGRIAKRDLPTTLLEREISLLTWAEGVDVVVAPLTALASGTYALATPELGLVAEVVVDDTLVPVVERAWPPRDVTTGAGTSIFCGEAAGAVAPGPFELAPTGLPASVGRGLDDSGAFLETCVRVEPIDAAPAGIPLLPPALVGGAALEPRLLVISAGGGKANSCVPPEVAVGPTCGAVADDRVELHAPAPAFVAFETPSELLGVVAPGASLVLRGFEPSSEIRVKGLGFDALGARFPIDLEIRTSAARPHLVINEVLSNPVGAEARSEWIELVNDGVLTVKLEGFVVDDGIEPVSLPAREISPGAFVLLAAEGYAPDPELDLAPPADVTIVMLPRLGRGGLANSGELLRLRDPDENVVSRFPARPAPGPGQSVARRVPDAPDSESASFAPHAAPGASPGAANVVEEN